MTQPIAPPPAELFPTETARRETEAWLTTTLAEARAAVAAGKVSPNPAPGWMEELEGFDFAAACDPAAVAGWVIAQLRTGITQVTHPGYFGLFNPAPSFPAECADRIVAQFNPQLASATTSPVAVAMEAHVIRQVGRRAGFPAPVAGHFTTGGSEANFTALICALLRAEPAYAARGIRGFAGQPVFYVSADAHLAWAKIAVQAGLGRDAMRAVATDAAGRMDTALLAAMIAADRACGCVPVMLAATAGTTGAGMVDPLAACAAIAFTERLWLHVDAAWGGGLIASPLLAGVLDGLAAANSVTIDAHKWFATTMGCGMFLTTDHAVLPEAFRTAAAFMPSNDPLHDPYVASLQWSRRFLGLRLFMALATSGWDGFARHVERATALAELLADRLRADGWRVLNRSPMAVLCLVPPPGAARVRQIVARVVQAGEVWVSATLFDGTPVIRACIANGRTTEAEIGVLVQQLNRAAGRPDRTEFMHMADAGAAADEGDTRWD